MVTIGFLPCLSIDVVGHSAISEGNPPPNVRETFDAFREYVEGRVDSFDGRVWVWEGDGGLCAFYEGSETIAEDAARCGLEICGGLAEFNREESKIQDEVRVRIAIHCGGIHYREDIGNIHSDVINFVAHLEATKDKTASDSISASSDIVSQLGESKNQFHPNGVFESREVYSTSPSANVQASSETSDEPARDDLPPPMYPHPELGCGCN